MYDTQTVEASCDVSRAEGLAKEVSHWPSHEQEEFLKHVLVGQRQAAIASNRNGDAKTGGAYYGGTKAGQPLGYSGEAAGGRPGLNLDNVEQCFTYQAWDKHQIRQAEPVREAIIALAKAILRGVPDCPDRSVAIRKLRELRMDVNAAITHRGQF